MSLNRLFELVEKIHATANWRAAFGEPQVAEGRTLIPVAQVGYGYGLGFGSGTGKDAETPDEPPSQGEGGRGGGGASARPLGVLVVTPDGVHFEETVDARQIVMGGMAVGALALLQLGLTLRAIFARRA